ncbi:LamG-like jellyroll fold domain-containing protein [Phytomonospora sp. NPDC050363]|uniref:LamG domain-containing protein n=1 Tax=Phytomonospora sp. NPDC050363 TaxID=3155642 RepID=UPI0033E3C3C1
MIRPLTRVTTAFLAVAAMTAAFAAPVHAEDEPPDGELPPLACPSFPGEPSAEDEFEAYRLALACGVDVEVLSLRDIDRQVFATTAGTLDAQIAVEPYQVRNAEGAWTPIDPTLVPRPDGSAAAAATVIGVSTSAGGDAPFVTATDPGGGVLSLRWPKGPLPAPVVSGSVATYPNVLPDIDLAVQAESVGFSWLLIVKTEEARANPELATIEVGIETVGLTVVEDPESSRIEVLDAEGSVIFEAGQGIMWDSSTAAEPAGFAATAEEPASDPGRIGDVDVQHTGTGITLVPDTAMLADPDLTFPLYIDPPFTSTRKAWANVLQSKSGTGWTGDSSWPRSGGMRVGLDTWSTCGSGCGLWRSAITLNIGALKGKYIASASVNMLQTHMGGCDDRYLQLWRTGAISNGTSWNGVDWLYGEQLQSKLVPSSNQTGCSGKDNEWVEFDGGEVKKRVQSAADQRHSTISFGLRSSNEDTRDAWRRIKTDTVKLHVTYYIYPPQPDRLTVDGTSCKSTLASAPWIGERYPTFSGRARSSEDESVYMRLRVHKANAATNLFWYRTPDPVAPYTTVTKTSTTALADGEYRWQARSDARQTDAVNSGYTGYCYFKVDATKPTVPVVTGPPGAVTAGTNVSIDVSGTDPVVGGFSSGVDRFEYSWNSDDFGQTVTSTGSATITRSAITAGRHVLYVRTVDKAGNKSNHRVFTFFAGRDVPATPMGMWRFDGDAYDDTGHGHDLSVFNGTAAYGSDGSGRANAALALAGSGCLSSARVPIRTDAAFTVALSVRLDSATGYTKVLTQGGDLHSAYQIQHDAATNKWTFSLLTDPGAEFAWKSLSVANPVAYGQWLHIAGSFDPETGLQRMFFNGALVAEQTVAFTAWNATKTFTVGCLRNPSGSSGHYLNGAVDNVGVWQGLATSAQLLSAKSELPAAAEVARWELRDGGADSSRYGRGLTLPASAERGFDPFGRPDGALVLDGQSCAKTGGAIVPAGGAFAVSAWVKPTAVGGGRYQAVLSQTDAAGNGLVLAIDENGAWEFGALSTAGPASAPAFGPMSVTLDRPVAGKWQHMALAYDGVGSWTLYVNGREQTFGRTGSPGKAAGPFAIGCLNNAHHFGGMLHDVRVMRGDLSETGMPGLGIVPAELASYWSLAGSGADESGNGRDLAFTGGLLPTDGWWANPDGAAHFTGTNSAATSVPVVNTDESFTVGAWVKLDSIAENSTFVSGAGVNNTAFRLRLNATSKLFEFAMVSKDAADTEGAVITAAKGGPTVATGIWYFVVGSFDLRTKALRLYVNGSEVAKGTGPSSPWKATGPLVIGAAGKAVGRWQYTQGNIDDVVVWQGTVSARSIANMYGTDTTAGS